MFNKNLKVLFVSAEASPYAKTGGLADVAGSLPKALKKLGADVRVAIPKYKSIPTAYTKKAEQICEFPVHLGWRKQLASIHEYNKEVPTYFIENNFYFFRDHLYGYSDDYERFAFFCKTVLEMLPQIGFQPDVIHCNDWQTGPICILLRENYKRQSFYRRMQSLYTIHNIQYQGVFGKESLTLLGLSDMYFHPDGIEFYGQVNYMKAGLLFSDAISTVSPTYAKEIQTPQYGYVLDGVLRKQSHILHGIINGIDYEQYDPETDKRIYANFSKEAMEDKSINKAELQKELGLPTKDVPMIGLISRLVDQKGLDLIAQVIDTLMQKDLQFVILGTGDAKYENLFKEFQRRFPEKISANIMFDEALAQKIYAGCDLFLMPSLFEPCGLGQIFSLRYGTVPIVRRTGGLADTIRQFYSETGQGNGFLFDGYEPNAMLGAIYQALDTYEQGPNIWNRLVKNAMSSEYSWNESAKKYLELYQEIL